MTTEPRLAPLSDEAFDPEAREILDPLRAMGGGSLLNIFRTLARHPALLRRWLVFGNHVLGKSSLPARERELVILRVGWLCRAQYEWAQHVVIAKREGVSAEEIARVAAGPDAAGWSAADAALLRATDELHHYKKIGDATWKELSARLDERQLLDLVFAVGQYTLVSMALNTLGVPLDAGLAGFPDPGPGEPGPPR